MGIMGIRGSFRFSLHLGGCATHSPNAVDSILVENSTRADQRDLFQHGLSNQQTVEGVFVARSQGLDRGCVIEADEKQLEVIPRDLSGQERGTRLSELQLT